MDQRAKDLSAIRAFYDTVYHKEAKNYAEPPNHFRKLAARLGIHEKQRILDVGCGAGHWLFAASRRGAIPYGIDLSENAICVCRTVMPGGTFYAQAAETLPFEDRMFDFVSCLGALEHFVNPEAALKEMVRVARTDAKVLLLVPNADFLTLRLGLYSGTHQVDAKEEVHSLKKWTKLFEDCGLKVRDRWRDLHVLSWPWISSKGPIFIPLRAAQALALAVWPLAWQYQVYHLCTLQR